MDQNARCRRRGFAGPGSVAASRAALARRTAPRTASRPAASSAPITPDSASPDRAVAATTDRRIHVLGSAGVGDDGDTAPQQHSGPNCRPADGWPGCGSWREIQHDDRRLFGKGARDWSREGTIFIPLPPRWMIDFVERPWCEAGRYVTDRDDKLDHRTDGFPADLSRYRRFARCRTPHPLALRA